MKKLRKKQHLKIHLNYQVTSLHREGRGLYAGERIAYLLLFSIHSVTLYTHT